MKICRVFLSIAAFILALAALACTVIAYWDKLEQAFFCLRDKVTSCRLSVSAEADDFVADWEEA